MGPCAQKGVPTPTSGRCQELHSTPPRVSNRRVGEAFPTGREPEARGAPWVPCRGGTAAATVDLDCGRRPPGGCCSGRILGHCLLWWFSRGRPGRVCRGRAVFFPQLARWLRTSCHTHPCLGRCEYLSATRGRRDRVVTFISRANYKPVKTQKLKNAKT